MPVDRRTILKAGLSTASAGLVTRASAGLVTSGAARAQGPNRIAIGTVRDLQGSLDPVSRLGALEANILRTVCPGLIAFRPGTFDWQPALAKAIRLNPTP